MNILIVSPAPPNMYHRIRLHHLIKALGKDHQLYCIFMTDNLENQPSVKIEANFFYKSRFTSIIDCLNPLAINFPFEISYCKNIKLRQHLKKITNNYDVIIIKRLRAVQFLPENIQIPVIIDTTDAMSFYYQEALMSVPWFKKALFLHEATTYKRYEKDISKKYKNWVVCSKEDAKYLKKVLTKDVEVFVVPNVVDTDYFQSTRKSSPRRILFSGLMGKFINQSAAYFLLDKVYSYIRKKVPDIKIDIVGPNPPRKLLRYQTEYIKVHGKVKDIRKFIEKATVIVVPVLVGTGTRNKILQAWSQKRPVVSTSIGASGLKGKNNVHSLITNSSQNFADCVIRLLNNKNLSRRLTTNAYRLVTKEYSLETMRREYNKVLDKVINVKKN